MKRTALLAATAITFSSLASTPALAVVPPMHDTSGMTPQEVCDEQLRPNNPNSKFLTEATNEDSTGVVPVGNPYPTTAVGAPEGHGTPTYSNVLVGNGYYRNGQSPNVWAESQATATYPQTRQLFDHEQATQSVTTFDCRVWKDPGGPNHGPDEIEPAGLQSYGNSTTTAGTPIAAAQDYVITNVPFVVTGVTVNALICISPNSGGGGKPGTWRGKHGFDEADCPLASSTAAGTVPSNNAPNI